MAKATIKPSAPCRSCGVVPEVKTELSESRRSYVYWIYCRRLECENRIFVRKTSSKRRACKEWDAFNSNASASGSEQRDD